MIHSFACKKTEDLFNCKIARKFKNFERIARRKLLQIHAATNLLELRIPPGNMLENLHSGRRVNTAYVLMVNGEFVLFGKRMAHTK